ncbi:MAG: hypothetical protein ACXWT0_17075 [Methylobacter sp.]
MNLKKRGLGRGLEALLVDVASREEQAPLETLTPADFQPVQDDVSSAPVIIADHSATEAKTGEVDGRTAMVVELFKSIQREHLVLLEEAEALRKMIEEFESIIRADLP